MMVWYKYMRRLPALSAIMSRMQDFYLELTWQFESSVLPFIGKIAPSDTYKVWKRGSCLRADLTLAGFDGLRLKRKRQSILFFGDGDAAQNIAPGSLLHINHEREEICDTLEGQSSACNMSDAEMAYEVKKMFQAGVIRSGIDTSQARLMPLQNWRGYRRTEQIGGYRCLLYEMNNVTVRFKQRKERPATEHSAKDVDKEKADEELKSLRSESVDLDHVLTPEEQKLLREALKEGEESEPSREDIDGASGGVSERLSRKDSLERGSKADGVRPVRMRSASVDVEGDRSRSKGKPVGRRIPSSPRKGNKGPADRKPKRTISEDRDAEKAGADAGEAKSQEGGMGEVKAVANSDKEADEKKRIENSGVSVSYEKKEVNEVRKGVKPILWLSRDFPLDLNEVLPLLDLLSNKVKAVKRVKEIFESKIPKGMVPVKVAIPIVPTIRVSFAFSKFIPYKVDDDDAANDPANSTECEDGSEQFVDCDDGDSGKPTPEQEPSFWVGWMGGRAQHKAAAGDSSTAEKGAEPAEWLEDPFVVPKSYTRVTLMEKRDREQAKKKEEKKKRMEKRTGKKTEQASVAV